MANERELLAIEIVRSGSDYTLARGRMLRVPTDFEPMPSLGGDLMVVSYSGAKVVQAMPVRVPSTVRLEGASRNRAVGRTEVADDLSVTLLLDASAVDRVDLQDESGATIAALDGEELDRLRDERGPTTQPMASTPGARTTADLEAEFPHVRFLDADAGDELPGVFKLDSETEGLTTISADAADALLSAMKRISLPALSAVRSVGIAKFDPKSGVMGVSFGSSMLVSELLITDEKELAETVVHEATHNLQFLLDGEVATALLNPDAWPDAVREAAEDTIAKHRLAAGVTAAWADLHETGVDLNVVDDYQGDDWLEIEDEHLAQERAGYGGFASPYGSSLPGEDMAEYVARLTVPENGGESVVCGRLRTAPSPFPVDLAVPYAKVRFLQALDLLDSTQVEACAGSPEIKGPPGIHLGGEVHFTDGVKAGWLDQDGGRFLAVFGNALPYRFMLRVLAPDDQALGMHRLDEIGWGNLNDDNNAVYLAHEENNFLARTSAGGLVLVTEANPDRVEGAVFLLSLRNAAGAVTDAFAVSTFSVVTP